MRNPDWWESYTHNVTSESINLSSLPRLFGHRGKCAYSIHTDLPQKRARKTGVWWVLRHPGVCVFWGTWGPGFSRSSSQPATRVNFNTRDAWKEKMKAPRDLLLMNGVSAWRLTWITIGREATTTTATKTSLKKWIRAASNFTARIPSRSIREMLANFSGVEF